MSKARIRPAPTWRFMDPLPGSDSDFNFDFGSGSDSGSDSGFGSDSGSGSALSGSSTTVGAVGSLGLDLESSPAGVFGVFWPKEN